MSMLSPFPPTLLLSGTADKPKGKPSTGSAGIWVRVGAGPPSVEELGAYDSRYNVDEVVVVSCDPKTPGPVVWMLVEDRPGTDEVGTLTLRLEYIGGLPYEYCASGGR